VEKMTPRAMVEAYPDLAAWVDSMFVEQTYYSGLHYAFLQQLADKNIAGAWESFAGRALAVWGKADFISGEEDHALIARIVNARSPGNGEFVALDNSDHGFYEAATPEESFASWGQPGRALNPAIVTLLREWSDRALAGPKD
jgi:pimeloyl-ACP methyl ester carboxylesterase